jgi:TPR repeat protein
MWECKLKFRFFFLLLIAYVQIGEARMMDLGAIDWKSLQFTCTKEQNPQFDAESDVWFQRARALEKANKEANDAEMIRLYQQAAERGHYKAMLNLSIIYAHGRGVAVDRRKALKLVEKAMGMQSAHAYYLMGIMLEQGVGVRMDAKAALSYFRKSADMGNRYGQAAVGESLMQAFQQQAEPARSRGKAIGRQVLDCAIAQGSAESAYSLGLDYMIVERDPLAGLAYFQKAASLGSKESMWMLYEIYDRGRDGIARDPKRAACYYALFDQLRHEPNKLFPDIDRFCTLSPPAPIMDLVD